MDKKYVSDGRCFEIGDKVKIISHPKQYAYKNFVGMIGVVANFSPLGSIRVDIAGVGWDWCKPFELEKVNFQSSFL